MRLVLLGPPGAGKGTQAVQLAAATAGPHIATGDIFRDHVRNETPLGLAAKAAMARGDLVPDETVIGMVTGRLCDEDAADGFILDGFPRTVAQAETLEAFLQQAGRPLDGVLRFSVDEERIVKRIVERRSCPSDGSVFHLTYARPKLDGRCDACGGELVQRPDDNEDVVRRRLEEYHAKTEPLETFYAARSLLLDIDANAPVEDVTAATLTIVERLRGVRPIELDRTVDLTETTGAAEDSTLV